MQQSVTQLLKLPKTADNETLNKVCELLYSDIKRLAHSHINKLPPNSTISPTVLVHECFLKLEKTQQLDLQNKRHIMCIWGKCMRQFLIDYHRSKNTNKRKGEHVDNGITSVIGEQDINIELMDLNKVMIHIEKINPEYAELVDLKLFAGLTVDQLVEALNMPRRTLMRKWSQVKSLIYALLEEMEVIKK
ncbi:ECF-type sigma factor [Marinicella sp. S1101]|uniref:ECF-type sigma factor n=1 Tax=Marinicella marina TaxID=2996016 RepID=UPI002260F076|nr:ECF-type sigma factor [Marinicella marina]MCX7555066.1 ECF-type sigma factor [Marinicella marina]MDJ1141374.1 ECF-type sigma factor [Marinicella marina]